MIFLVCSEIYSLNKCDAWVTVAVARIAAADKAAFLCNSVQ